jgi:hypothetical protein
LENVLAVWKALAQLVHLARSGGEPHNDNRARFS